MLASLLAVGHLVVALITCMIAGILAIAGTMLWVSTTMGRSRTHTGIHVVVQGRSLYVLPMVSILGMCTLPSSMVWSLLSPVV